MRPDFHRSKHSQKHRESSRHSSPGGHRASLPAGPGSSALIGCVRRLESLCPSCGPGTEPPPPTLCFFLSNPSLIQCHSALCPRDSHAYRSVSIRVKPTTSFHTRRRAMQKAGPGQNRQALRSTEPHTQLCTLNAEKLRTSASSRRRITAGCENEKSETVQARSFQQFRHRLPPMHHLLPIPLAHEVPLNSTPNCCNPRQNLLDWHCYVGLQEWILQGNLFNETSEHAWMKP